MAENSSVITTPAKKRAPRAPKVVAAEPGSDEIYDFPPEPVAPRLTYDVPDSTPLPPGVSTENDGHIIEGLRQLATGLGFLRPDPKNARVHGARNLDSIVASLNRFGQRKPVVATPDGTVIAGNGTLAAATKLGWPTLAVVRVDDDARTAAAYAIADNRTAELAEWDEEVLSDTLRWLLEGSENALADIGATGFTQDEVNALLALSEDDGDNNGDADLYTKKIKAPIYEPTGERPAVVSLVDREKTSRLLGEIEAAPDLPDDVRDFLRHAAARHNVFNYERIAEFYAHATPELQALMEKSALVIIDFDKAIEQGFVIMSDHMAEAYNASQGA